MSRHMSAPVIVTPDPWDTLRAHTQARVALAI